MADEIVEHQEDRSHELEDGHQQQEDGQQQQQQQKKPDEGSNDLKSAMAELATTVKGIAESSKKEKEPEITEEQKREFWAIYDPEQSNKEFFKQWFRLNPDATKEEIDQMKSLFGDVQKGIVKQAVRGAMNLASVELEKIREEFKGISDYVAKQKAKETRDAFNEAYPVLAEKKYDKLVALAAKNLDQTKFKTDEEYFKALADSAAEHINLVREEAGLELIDLGAKKEEKKTAATTPRLPRSSAGGGGGAGGGRGEGGGDKSKKDDVDSLL